jgi:hypothetical protein
MNISLPNASSTSPQRRGFALILTLSVLTVVIALTGVLIGYLDTARRDASSTKALLQANLYFTDVKKIISKFKDKKALYATLYLTPVPLRSKDGRFSLMLACRPTDNAVNINWLGMGNIPVMKAQYNAAQKVFESLMQSYEVRDPNRLEEMVIEAINGTQPQEEQSRLRQKNGIISYQQFTQLLSRYQFEADDVKIGKIPWKQYFVFQPASKLPADNLIAGDYLSADLLAMLFNIDKELVKSEWTEAEGALKTFLSTQGIPFDKALFAEKFVDRSRCEVTYDYGEERFTFAFIDREGEVKDFEFYGKQ